MRRRRTLRAEAPGERLRLSVAAAHPELGDFFLAELRARRADRAARNEHAGLATLLWCGHHSAAYCTSRSSRSAMGHVRHLLRSRSGPVLYKCG